MADSQTALNRFYKEFACPTTTRAELDILRADVDNILRQVARKDKRFQFEIINIGSQTVGISAVVACEFDVLLRLDIDGMHEESKLSTGYARFKLTESRNTIWKEVSEGGYLHPRKLTDIFQKYVSEIVKSIPRDPGRELKVGGQGTVATTVSTTAMHTLMVIAVKCRGWPSSATASWLQPGYEKKWPSKETIATIKQNGFELVAKYVTEDTPGVNDRGQNLDLLWRMSVSRGEALLLRSLDDSKVSLCHKKCLIILKAVRLNDLYMASEPPVGKSGDALFISSYHLQTVLLREMQAVPDTSQWTEEKLLERFLSFLENFNNCVSRLDLPSFFFPELNLFKGRRLISMHMAQTFMRLRQNPVKCLGSIQRMSSRDIIMSRLCAS